MDDSSRTEQRIAGVVAMDQPIRRDLFRLLSDGRWWGRDDAAEALDIGRSVVAFHLDKLVDAGVIETRFERTSGRTGPGAGRPSKLYRLAAAELAASIPERHYDLAGTLLASAIAESTRSGRPVSECLHDVAVAAGHEIGDEIAQAVEGDPSHDLLPRVVDALRHHGYEPESSGPDEIALANCPFHQLAERERALVCGMNLDLLTGVLEGVDGDLTARLDPTPGHCCVRISAGTAAGS